LRKSEDKL